ncbi:MAG: hypothetical protein H0T62_11195 [Parachlamydiaceae bacterium]|nr:hypothetical protein [Parachlamydiaceae bacterium]
MQSIQPTASSSSIPQGLKETLPYPDSPWKFSDRIFSEMQQQPVSQDQSYKLLEIKNGDPEYQFILKYFDHSKPMNYHIKSVQCIHTPYLTDAFVSNLKKLETKEFKPEIPNDAQYAHRQETLQKWEELTHQFYPIKVEGTKRAETLIKVRILPLWHGSSKPKCHSIATSGFTYFGKHHFVHPNAKKGPMGSTDPGYFGSGMYFTTSAQYASMYSNGHMLLAFVAMNEPYPVVSDVPHPKKCSDMKMLESGGAYQTYNTHYIPVANIEPNSPYCMEYYPCISGQKAAWDEIVVFQETQTLPRYWVELEADLLKKIPKSNNAFVEPAPGFNIVGICQSQACDLEGKKFVVRKGLKEFDLGEEYFDLRCSCCNSPTDLIDSVILKDCSYSYIGVNKDGKKVTGENLKVTNTDTWPVAGWKAMKIKVQPKK